MTYSRFMEGLTALGLGFDRKILADIAVNDEAIFKSIVEKVVKALGEKPKKAACRIIRQNGGPATAFMRRATGPPFSCFLTMQDQLEQLRAHALAEIESAADETALESARVKYLGRAGSISLLSEGMKSLGKEDKPRIGKLLNEVRAAVTAALDARKAALEAQRDAGGASSASISPCRVRRSRIGALHPITQLQDRAVQIFRRMGFVLEDGPDIETEWHCFDALNTPADHPARNEQDTFYLPDGRLLRTHTSTIQIRAMESPTSAGAHYRAGRRISPRRSRCDPSRAVQSDGRPLRRRKCNRRRPQGHARILLPRALRQGRQMPFPAAFFPFTEPSFEIDIKATGVWWR